MAFLRNLSTNAVSTGLVFSLGLLNQTLLANALGQAGYGRLALWTNAALIAALVLGEWIRRGSTYVVGREGAASSARDNALLYALVLVVAAAAVTWVGRAALAGVLGEEIQHYWLLWATARCPRCATALWSGYTAGPRSRSSLCPRPYRVHHNIYGTERRAVVCRPAAGGARTIRFCRICGTSGACRMGLAARRRIVPLG